MAVKTVAEFVEALRRCPLLDPAQLDQLVAEQSRFAEPRALAKELMSRGWLTPYQVNHLFQGKESELLLGSYVLLERLGEGGMGAVFKARHRRLDRIVAVKLIRKERLADEESVKRFHREIRAAAQLSHPHIVLAFDADQADGVHFFVMEYVEGTDLGKQVQMRGPLPIPLACEYVRQAALGLQHAHEKGLVHRDIKPSNFLLATTPGRQTPIVKLLDMGLARLRTSSLDDTSGSDLTQVGSVVGTPDYMAPEQAENSHQVDIRGDLYSLGCTFYLLLAGQVPFPNRTPIEKLFHHRYHEAQLIEELCPDVSEAVADIVRKLMAKKPEDRFQTPAELVAALEAVAVAPPEPLPELTPVDPSVFSDIVPSDTHDSQPSPRREKRSAERRRWLWVNVAGAVVLLGALGLFLTLLGRPTPLPTESESKGNDPVHDAAVVELRGLRARAADPGAERDPLRQDLLAFRRTYPGTPQALEAASILRRLPSPLDTLTPFEHPPADGWDGPAGNLVAVVGEYRQRHWGTANCVALSTDGKTLASGGGDHVVRLWETATMRERLALHGHAGIVSVVAFAPDGKSVLSVSGPPDRTARLWDTTSGKELYRFGGPGPAAVSAAAFAADGKHVVLGGQGWLGVWEPETSKLIRRFENLPGLVSHLAVSSAGHHVLLVLAGEKLARLWDVDAGKELLHFEGHKGEVVSVAFSPDGKRAATAGETAARLWDVASGKELHRLAQKGATGAAFAPDGAHVFTCGADKMLRLWDVASGKELRHYEGHEAPVRGVVFGIEGKKAYSAGDDTTVRRWDVDAGKEIEPLASPAGGLTNVVFGPEGRKLFGALRGRRLFTWDVVGDARYRPFAEEALGVTQVALAPDGRLALSSREAAGVPVWDVASGQLSRALGDQEGVRCLAFSPDGQTALVGGRGGTLRLWDVAAGKDRRLPAPKGVIAAAAFAPDGRQVATGEDRIVHIWEVSSGKETLDLSGLPGEVRSLAYSPDNRRLFAACGDVAVHRWVFGGVSPILGAFEGHKREVSFVVVSPDSQFVASASESGEVIVWDALSGKSLNRWQLAGPISGIAFASDSRHLATANGNGTTYILRLEGPELKGGS